VNSGCAAAAAFIRSARSPAQDGIIGPSKTAAITVPSQLEGPVLPEAVLTTMRGGPTMHFSPLSAILSRQMGPVVVIMHTRSHDHAKSSNASVRLGTFSIASKICLSLTGWSSQLLPSLSASSTGRAAPPQRAPLTDCAPSRPSHSWTHTPVPMDPPPHSSSSSASSGDIADGYILRMNAAVTQGRVSLEPQR
jgi:hypothetical protein